MKPGNILVGTDGHAYLSDFGLIRRSRLDTELTKTGQFMGTVDYVAPEQIRGEEVDGEADVYSLGCVLYECLTGQAPFVRDTEVAGLYAHLQDPPPKVTDARPKLPAELDGVIAKAMAKRPEDRYATASELARAAEAAIDQAPPAGAGRGRRGLVAALVAAVVVLGGLALALALSSGGRSEPTPTPKAEPTLAPNQVVSFDPEIGEVLTAVSPVKPAAWTWGTPDPVGGLGSIVVGAGGVWAIEYNGISHIDPETNEKTDIIVKTWMMDVAIANGDVWATSVGPLARIDPATDTVQEWMRVGGGRRLLAVGARSVWVQCADGPLFRVDEATNETLAKITDLETADDVAFGAGSVWVLNDWDGELLRIDPETNEVADRIPVTGRLSQVAVGDEGVWVLDADAGAVTQIDPSDLSVVKTFRVGNDPADIEIALGVVWVANRGDGTLSKIDPAFGSVETIEVGGPVAAIAGDEETGTLWLQLAEHPCTLAEC